MKGRYREPLMMRWHWASLSRVLTNRRRFLLWLEAVRPSLRRRTEAVTDTRKADAPRPRRGEVWWVDFSPSVGTEIRDEHPAFVISTDYLNQSPFGVLIVIPISSSSPPLRIHVDMAPGEAGLRKASRLKCDQIGKVDTRRFRPNGRIGVVKHEMLRRVETVLRRILEL